MESFLFLNVCTLSHQRWELGLQRALMSSSSSVRPCKVYRMCFCVFLGGRSCKSHHLEGYVDMCLYDLGKDYTPEQMKPQLYTVCKDMKVKVLAVFNDKNGRWYTS